MTAPAAGPTTCSATWNSDDHPDLAALLGVPAGGQWTLSVADRARRDVGTFDAWSLDVGVGQSRPTLEGEATPGLIVPDNQPKGVTSEIELTGAGTISSLSLDLDLTHTYICDLKVTLAGPDGTKADDPQPEGRRRRQPDRDLRLRRRRGARRVRRQGRLVGRGSSPSRTTPARTSASSIGGGWWRGPERHGAGAQRIE